MRRTFELIATALGWLMIGIAFVLAAPAVPFLIVAWWLFDRGDDLRAGWRRGRRQNRLWIWAHRAKNGYR